VAVSKTDKKTSITSARNKIDNSNNNGTKNEIKNPQTSVIKSKPNYHYYYQNIHSISSSTNYQAKKKMMDQVTMVIIILILRDRRGAL
jgi:hypothetical protein